MEICMAPMEGITEYRFRLLQHEYFGGVDRYYTPFFVPNEAGILNAREAEELTPENNSGMTVIPQLLTARADLFVQMAKTLQARGYHEVNLNLGCPSGTVFSKHRGAGFLLPEEREHLREFLTEIFLNCPLPISVKTRIGVSDRAEFAAIVDLYRQFPFCEVIVHPRVRQAMYRGEADREAFSLALQDTPWKVTYNGDLFTVTDIKEFQMQFPGVSSVMLGRGLIANPALAAMARGGEPLDNAKFQTFHDALFSCYAEVLSGTRHLLFRMKEFWGYWGSLFANGEKAVKKIRKSESLPEYTAAVRALVSSCPIPTGVGFHPFG